MTDEDINRLSDGHLILDLKQSLEVDESLICDLKKIPDAAPAVSHYQRALRIKRKAVRYLLDYVELETELEDLIPESVWDELENIVSQKTS